jgi:hypothetical protein
VDARGTNFPADSFKYGQHPMLPNRKIQVDPSEKYQRIKGGEPFLLVLIWEPRPNGEIGASRRRRCGPLRSFATANSGSETTGKEVARLLGPLRKPRGATT